MSLTIGEFCAGAGGLSRAVEEVFDATPAWFFEFDSAPSKILAHHYPKVPNYGDMTTANWSTIPKVDILSGGTPCQDLSGAGKRKGMTEGTRSNLWVQMREAAAVIEPAYVFWENVQGAYSATAHSEMERREGRLGEPGSPTLRALGRVLGDLSSLGFDCEWHGLRASDLGFAHNRFRVFVLASHPERIRRSQGHPTPECGPAGTDGAGYVDERPALHSGIEWGKYGPAIRRHETVLGRPAPDPTEPTGRGGSHRSSPAFYEWLMAWPAGWITGVPGVSWADQIKIAGNGVVTQQATAALRAMLSAQMEVAV